MSFNLLLLPVVMAVAELAGALAYTLTRSDLKRVVLACFGLGFAWFIVVADVMPDALENNPAGWLPLGLGAVAAAALMFKAGRQGPVLGRAGALAGMALHNLCEGIVLAAAGPVLSPVVVLGAIGHKLPEGIVVFSLADGLSTARRWALAVAFSVLIPLGTQVVFPEALRQPVLAFAAGVLFVVLSKILLLTVGPLARAREQGLLLPRMASSVAGMVLAGLTCLVV